MESRTMLSDEEMVQRRNMHHTASDSAPLSVYFLIANARLEFSISRSKESLLKIPNRERIAILHLRCAARHLGTHARYPYVRSAIFTDEGLSSLPSEAGRTAPLYRPACEGFSTRAILEASTGELRMRVCDGCGAPADEAHVRQRIERLEMATRFRPIHIQGLLR